MSTEPTTEREDCTLIVFERLRIERTEVNGIAYVRIWRGKQRHPYANYRFRSFERREEYIEEQRQGETASLKFDASRKAKAKEQTEAARELIKVGTILVNSWGYDQTNVDSYQVVSKTRATVKLQRIGGAYDETGYLAGQYTPCKDAFVTNDRILTKRITQYGVSFTHGGCDIWDGKRSYYESSYA